MDLRRPNRRRAGLEAHSYRVQFPVRGSAASFAATALCARLNWISRRRRKLDKNVPTLSGARIELPPRGNYCRRGTEREGHPKLLADLMGEAAGSSRISVRTWTVWHSKRTEPIFAEKPGSMRNVGKQGNS